MAALVLAPLAIAAAWFGGWFWIGLVTITVVGLFGEWMLIVQNLRTSALLWGFASLAGAGLSLALNNFEIANLSIALGLFAMFLFSARGASCLVARSGSPTPRRRCLPACCCGAIRATGSWR